MLRDPNHSLRDAKVHVIDFVYEYYVTMIALSVCLWGVIRGEICLFVYINVY